MRMIRSVWRAATFSLPRFNPIHQLPSRPLFCLSSPVATSTKQDPFGFKYFATNTRSVETTLKEDSSHTPNIKDSEILNAFKDLMAASWDELPNPVIHEIKKALSAKTNDKAGQEVLKNVFRAAEAVEEFGGMIMSLKMEFDDCVGLSGENAKPIPADLADALSVIYNRYSAYLDSFGAEEAYLQKKVETELGSKMIYLKMRCGGLGSGWGQVTVLGTSGLAGSYVEQRA